MHLSIVAYGTWGDVRPGIALGLALKDAGYGVRLIVTKDFADMVCQAGLDVHTLPVNKHNVMKQVSSRTNPLRVLLAVHREIAPALRAAGQELIAATQNTDVLVVNEWLIGLAEGIAQTRHLPLINIAMQPRIKTRHMPICTMPPLPGWLPFRRTYNRLSYDMAHLIRWWSYGRVLNTLRKTHLNLPPLSPGPYLDLLERTPSITLISPHVVSRPADWADHHHLTGYLFYDDDDWQPPDELVDFIADGKAPVYVGFGSMHDRDPEETTRIILNALEQANRRGVLYSGWAGLGQIALPDSVYRLEYAPHSWLFSRMAAVVHHSGAGTTAAALRAGVPSVPVPHSGDQPFWARRLHQVGGGTEPIAREQLTANRLAERILMAVEDTQLRNESAELGSRICPEDGAAKTVAAVERILASYQ